MSVKEFGELVEAAPKDFPQFGEPVEETSRWRSLLNAPIKGAIKGAKQLTSMLPQLSSGPIPSNLGESITEQFLPTQEKAPEGVLERAGRIGVNLAAGGAGGAVRKGLTALLGGLAGETTKQFGGGQLAQDIAELATMGAPDLAKSIPAKQAQSRAVNFLRGKGFTENEITPLLQDPKKLSRYAKFASKGEKTNKLMRDTYEKFDNVYSSIREQGQNLPGLQNEQIDSFLGEFQKTINKIPKFYTRQIKEEINDLLNSELKFTDFLDFEQAINARIKGISGGKAVLGTLKEATKNAKQAISPDLAHESQLANQLYGKRAEVTKHLSTDQISDLIDLGETASLIAGIADGNLVILTKTLGAVGGRKLAREMLINPRLQNIGNRMLSSLKKNKLSAAQKLYQIFRKEALKSDPDLEFPDFNETT